MAQTYTLDEAARTLGLSVEDFKRRLRTEWTSVRSFRDGSTLRFRDTDIQELARKLSVSSDEIPAAPKALVDDDDDALNLGAAIEDLPTKPETPFPTPKPSKSASQSDILPIPDDLSLALGDPDVYLLADEPASSKAKTPSPTAPPSKKKPDSELKLGAKSGKLPPTRMDIEDILTDEIQLADVPSLSNRGMTAASASGKLTPSKSSPDLGGVSGKLKPSTDITPKPKPPGESGRLKPSIPLSGKLPKQDTSSEFELTLDADSDEFELNLTSDSSDEIALGELPKPKNPAGRSGINLNRPMDSGVSLEKRGGSSKKLPTEAKAPDVKGPKTGKLPPPASSKNVLDDSSDDELSFDLELPDDDDAIMASTSRTNKNLAGPKSAKNIMEDDDDSSDFDLSIDMDDSEPGTAKGPKTGKLPAKAGKKPVMDEGSSEFELSVDDSSDMSLDLEATGSFGDAKKKDIFETDFQIPALEDESASEVVVLDESTDVESSEFELTAEDVESAEEDESGSEVVVLDDDSDDVRPVKSKSKAKKKSKKKTDDEDEEDGIDFDVDLSDDSSASQSMPRDLLEAEADEYAEDDEDEDEDDRPARKTKVVKEFVQVPIETKPWGFLPTFFLLPSVVIMFAAGIMGYELVHNMWGYQQTTKPSNLLVDAIAEQLDMKVKE